MNKKDFIEIWGDHVDLKSMLISMFICATIALGGYFIAYNWGPTWQLFLGIFGAVVGFVLSILFIQPKREVEVE